MGQHAILTPAFVIKADELAALNYLHPDHPQPELLEWINRGTDQKLKPSSVDMLMRTLFRDVASPSVVRLHRSAGLRAVFRTTTERNLFATAFAAARAQVGVRKLYHVTAIFGHREGAEQAIVDLKNAGIPDSAISLLWRASQFVDADVRWCEGHSKLGVAGAVAGGGVAGVLFGIAVLAIPGVGPIAAAGALAASLLPSVAAISGTLGATGGAIAKMLTDHDVDGASASYYEQQIRRGKIFVSIDTRIAQGQREVARDILRQSGGHTATRG